MKKHQIVLLFFTIGIFAVTLFFSFFMAKDPGGEIIPTPVDQYPVVKVYFSSTQQDPNTLYCERTYSVERTVSRLTDNRASTPGELAYLAINELLKGPTEVEKNSGYFTSINVDSRVQKIIIESGIATVDFNQAFNEGVGGSCRVQAIRSQITETLKQFPEVKEVIISVNGDSDNTLQP